MPYDLLHVLNVSSITQCNVFKVRVAAEILRSSDCDGRCLAAPPRLAGQPPPAHPWPLCLDLRTRGLHSLRLSFSWSENTCCQHPLTLAISALHVLSPKSPFSQSRREIWGSECSRTWCLLFHQWVLLFQQHMFCKVQGQARFMSVLQSSCPGSFSSRSFVNC